MKAFAIAALAALLAGGVCGTPTRPTLPTVDLGYEIYRANSLNKTTKLYSFSNIRYAAPPTGENRFRAPQPPAQNRYVVQNKRPEPICPQGHWEPQPGDTKMETYTSRLFNYTLASQRSFERAMIDDPSDDLFANDVDLDNFNSSAYFSAKALDPRTTEDCLFLDLVVPEQIFERKPKSGRSAAVMVFIHGGSFFMGYKSQYGDPSALITRSQEGGNDGVIYVTLNYRLGAFGWMSGPTFQKDGTANAGLHDQLFALEWVQKHISKFGGDPERVTVFGHSAGGGSVMGLLTAYGGARRAPFSQIRQLFLFTKRWFRFAKHLHQALVQSPGIVPKDNRDQQEEQFQDYLRLLNVSNIEQARQLPTEKLQLANVLTVELSPGIIPYGLAFDGNILPALPSQLLAEGRFYKNVSIMTGYTEDEGTIYLDFEAKNGSDIQNYISNNFPSFGQETLDYITDVLYPPIFDGSQPHGYTNELERLSALIAEMPAFHGVDTGLIFEKPGALAGGEGCSALGSTLKGYITNFAQFDSPNQQGEPYFAMYGRNATVQNLNVPNLQAMWNDNSTKHQREQGRSVFRTLAAGVLPDTMMGVGPIRDPVANERCNWWQRAFDV